MHEIDLLLFESVDFPYLEVPAQNPLKTPAQTPLKTKYPTKNFKQAFKSLIFNKKEIFNSLSRITALLFPFDAATTNHSVAKLPVPNAEFEYNIWYGQGTPIFFYLPRSPEIIQRLLFRAALVEDLEELNLKLSVC